MIQFEARGIGAADEGIQSLLRDMGMQVEVHMCTDSGAAKGMASRRGLGAARHIEVHQVWLQGKVGDGTIKLNLVLGINNQADALTKQGSSYLLEEHLRGLDHHISGVRHSLMPSLSRVGTCV